MASPEFLQYWLTIACTEQNLCRVKSPLLDLGPQLLVPSFEAKQSKNGGVCTPNLRDVQLQSKTWSSFGSYNLTSVPQWNYMDGVCSAFFLL